MKTAIKNADCRVTADCNVSAFDYYRIFQYMSCPGAQVLRLAVQWAASMALLAAYLTDQECHLF